MNSGLSAEQLALLAHKLKQKQAKTGAAGIPRRQLSAPAPLSFAQQRLWLLDRLEPGSSAYTIPLAVRLVGALDSSALARAASEVVRRHEPLRTTFVEQGGTPWQRVAPPGPVPVPTIDLGGLAEGTRGETARRLRAEQDRLAFDLAVGPLYRLRLVRLAAAEHLLLIDFHHTVADGWSLAVCFNEISALYDAFVAGLASPLAELPIQYGDFAVWQREWLTGEVLARQVAYWRAALAGAPAALELPTDRPRPAVPGHRGDAVMVELPPALAQGLRKLSSAAGVSLFMTLFAAFAVLLGRLSGQDDLVVGSPAAGRGRVETEGLIGLFLNTLVLRVDTAGDPTCRALLARVKEVVLGAYAHQEIPFERLLEELQPERHLSRAPLFQVLFNMLSVPPARLALRGLDAEILPWVEPDAKLDVTLYVVDRQETLRLDLVYSVELFDRARAEEMVRQYECLLRQAVEAPEARIGSYTLVTEAAARCLPGVPGAPVPGSAWPGPITDCFAARAARHPERLCLVSEGRSVTWGELDAAIRGLARQLVSVDLRKGEVVAVWAHRDPGLVSAVMGVLAAGGVFLILDPAYPAARLAEYLRLARPRAWVAVAGAPEVPAEVEEALGELGGVPRLTAGGAMPADFAPVALEPDDAACLTFTSGSSGRPKGVVGRHGPLTWFYPFMAERFGLAAGDRFGMLSALSHDPLQRDLFTPLFFGASLAIPDPARMASPGYLAGWVRRHAVTVLHLTPAMLELLTASAEERESGEREMPSLARAFVVGDVLKRSDVLRLMALAPRLACFNLYGSTETQRSVSYFAVSRTPGPGREALPLGRGMDGVDLLVINRAGRLAGIGEVGEIVLRGPQLARGYLGDDALTDERFIADPLGSGARTYKTGDLGRYLPDGNAEMVGRADFQVKLRGFRIELGEIEAALKRQPGVEDCVAVLREDRPGDSGNPGNRRLVAYLVAEGAVDKSALRGRLAKELPDYMVPGALVVLPALPLTHTGKIDRLALPAPPPRELEGGGPGRELSPVEQLLAGLWSDLLEQPSVAPGDDFFALGGHSLLATRMISRVRDLLWVELGLRTLFEHPTLEQLAQAIERARGMAQVRPPIVARPQDEPTHLSFGQKRLWFLDQLEPGSAAYLLAGALRLDGNLRIDALAGAFSEIVRRHEVLRTSYAAERGEPVAVVAPPRPVALPVVDLGGLPAAVREPAALRLVGEHCARPIDLAVAPVLRLGLVRLSEETHLLLVAVHHVAADGWSLAILTRELVALYGALLAGEPSPLPELAVQYADFAHAQESWFGGDALAAELAFWKAALTGAPPALALPTDFPRPALPTGGGGQVTLALGRELTAAVEATARRLGATPFMLLLAAFAVLLSRYADQDDLVVGSPVAARHQSALEPLIGFFVNTLPLRVRLAGGAFAGLLAAVKETALSAYAHQDLPFEKLVEALMPERHLSRAPVFQVTFALQNLPFAELALPGLAVSAVPVPGRSQFDLDLALVPTPEGLWARLDFASDLFAGPTAERLLRHSRNLLGAAVAAPDAPVDDLPMLDAAERRQLLIDWSGIATPASPFVAVVDSIARQAAQRPDAVAVSGRGEVLDYRGLMDRSATVADKLVSLGVGTDDVIGLSLGRSIDQIVALLGILRAGAAYLPLDPALPEERRAWMLASSGVRLVIDQGVSPGSAGVPPAEHLHPEQLAYVLFTSGSTGRPKGVGVSHSALAGHAEAIRASFALAPEDRVLQFASLNFDVAAEEIFPTLTAGATLVLAPPIEDLPPDRFGAWAEQERLTVLNLPSPYWHEWVAGWGEQPVLPGGLRLVVVGSDRVEPEKLALWRRRTAGSAIAWANAYGLTEATVTSTLYRSGLDEASSVPVGRPLPGVTAHLLDRRGEPLPVGVPGQLFVGGTGLARGYLGRPDSTAERFVPDPFGSLAGGRLFATGDRARRCADGSIDLLGRLDAQVKIRGLRIEPGEIEHALTSCPDVLAAAVVAREDGGRDRRLVAYVVASGEPATAAELRRRLAATLPAAMVPSAFVFLDALPLTPSGKLDRRALPAYEGMTAGGDRPFTAPRTPLEQRLAALWAEVLGVDQVGLDDRFWDLGGHSLLATRLVSRLRDAFAVELPLRAIFEEPTLAGQARAIAERSGRRAVPLVARPRSAPLAVSFAQRRLWLLDRLQPGLAAYDMPAAVGLRGAFAPAVAQAAFAEIVRRHEVLRTVFVAVDGEPVQVVLPPPREWPLPLIDLGRLPAAAQADEAERLTAEEAARPFDLSRGPLLRTALLRFAAGDHRLLLNLHHIAADGWSIDVLVRELSVLSRAAQQARPSPLPELAVQYADFAAWQKERLSGETLAGLLEHWRAQLAGVPRLELPADRPRPAVQRMGGAAVRGSLAAPLVDSLMRLGRERGATLFMTLLAAFEVLAFRLSDQTDFAVGSPVAGRTLSEVEPLIGFFVNTLALRADLRGAPTFAQLLARTRQTALDAYAHQEMPFERLVEELAPQRDLAATPIFQIAFAFQEMPAPSLELGEGLEVSGETIPRASAKFDLTLDMARAAEGVVTALEYATDLFEPATASRWLAAFEVLLAGLAAAPETPVAELALLTSEERAQLLSAWNRTSTPYPRDASIAALFLSQAARQPDAPAVVAPDASLTYGDLRERAERLAGRLVGLGVAPGSRVVVLGERSVDSVVASLAVLLAGGCYLPLDPGDPPERVRFVLADSQAAAVIVSQSLPAELAELALPALSLAEEAGPEADLPRGIDADFPAYVMYTSGSTGRPKGVVVPQRAVVRLVISTDYVAIAPGDRVAHVSNPAFDASTFEIWGALLNGATVEVIPRAVALSPPKLAAYLAGGRVTTMFLTAALFNLLVRETPGCFSAVRDVLFGGEAADPGAVRACLADRPPRRLLNAYGPTESTTFATWHEVAQAGATVPIGLPIANTVIHVLDRSGEPVLLGVPGELAIGGDGLALGYHSRPGLTAERFVPDPFGPPGGRLYRTGDLVRRRSSGEIEFLGRIDHQVKLRGLRIELGEIEAHLIGCPGVKAAVVVVREDAPGDPESRRLVAYVVGETAGLKDSLRERLPEHMVPGAFVSLPSLPLNPNGKVDRRALPAPEAPAAREITLPLTPFEEQVAGLWAAVLGVEWVGLEDNFWDLGGHSLLASKVVARLYDSLGIEVPLATLFEQPTLGGFAAAICRGAGSERDDRDDRGERGERGERGGGATIRRRGPDEPPVLSFAQERLWLLDRLEPGSTAYNMPFATRLTGRLDVAALAGALSRIVARHDALRTVFPAIDGEPTAVISPAAALAVPVVDLSGLPAAVAREIGGRLVEEEARTPFDLAHGPLLRALLLRLGPEEHLLAVDMHHIVSDGWSVGLFFSELSALYTTCCAGLPDPLPELPIQYADFALWQRRWLEGAVLADHLDYWREQLAGAPAALDLPLDRPRPAVSSHRGGRAGLVLAPASTLALRALASHGGASLFMVLLAAMKLLLSRLAGEGDVVVGVPSAGRKRVETEGVIGLFLNTLVLRTDLAGNPTFAGLLDRVKATVLDGSRFQEAPFEKLLSELHPERDLSRAPFFQVLFNMINLPGGRLEMPGLLIEHVGEAEPEAKLDLTFYLEEEDDGIRIAAHYSADLFDQVRVEEMLRQYEHLLAQAAADPRQPIGAMSLLTAAARDLLPDPGAPLSDAWFGAVHQALTRNAAAAPQRTALVGWRPGDPGVPGDHWSYGELEARANQLARSLLARGVGKGDVVAIWAQRDAALVWAILGTLKAGATMMILDPAYPDARLVEYVQIGHPALGLAVPGARSAPPLGGLELVALPPLAAAEGFLAGYETGDPAVPVGPDDVACLTFTSGSTGKPKAVAGRHGSLSHFYPWLGERFELAPTDRWSMLSALAHDPLQRDVFSPFWFGAALCVPDPERIGSPSYLAGWIDEQAVSVVNLTPAMMDVLTSSAGEREMPTLRRAFVAGDLLKKTDVARLYRLAPNVACTNLYGATETQRALSFFNLPGDLGELPREVLPLGRAYAGAQLLVVNPAGQPAGVGEAGEVWIRSHHLAAGYLGDDASTAERFRANPFGDGRAGDRVYRTGDLGRFLPDGTVETSGRADFQVKIRGFRIELGEVEAALARQPGVHDAVAVVREGRLVAYLVAQPAPASAELRSALARELPDHMVPSVFAVLDRLPLSQAGKVDRLALPAPPQSEGGGGGRGLSPVESILAGLWAELLGVVQVGPEDSFFALGGHSLLATRMTSRVRDALGVELPLRALFEEPTLAGFARRVEQGRGGVAAPPLVRQPRPERIPLSFAQQRLWVLHLLDPGSSVYNMPAVLAVAGPLDEGALHRALAEVVRRHETLRTVIALQGDEPAQVILPFVARPIPAVDLTRLGEAGRTEAARLASEEMARPFDLATGPLFRARLLRLAPDEHRLVLNVHHIVSDGWSVGVLLSELSRLVRAFAQGEPSPLPELPVAYADFALWQRAWLAAGVLDAQLAYWRRQLAGLPPLELPTDRPRPRVQTFRGAVRSAVIPAATVDRLERLSRERHVTLFMTLLAAAQSLLGRVSGQEDFALGTPVAGRNRSATEGLIGFFVNTLVVRADLSGDPTFAALLERVRETALAAWAHQDVTFERVVEELAPERDLSRTPLFQVAFALQNLDLAPVDLGPGLSVGFAGKGDPTSRFDLSFFLSRRADGGMACLLEHSADLFVAGSIERLLAGYSVLLDGIAGEPDMRLGLLPLLGEAARRQLLVEWNQSGAAYPRDASIPGLVADLAARAPHRLAVVAGRDELTFGELLARATLLARRLAGLGVGPGSRVVLLVERSLDSVAASLAILLAGGCYVPLDPNDPPDRVRFVLADSAAAVVVVRDALPTGLAGLAAAVLVLSDPGGVEAPLPAEVSAELPAYVIYTSGSTGRPKGVVVPHRAVTRLVLGTDYVAIEPGDRVSHLANPAFDAAVFEVWGALLNGAALVVVPRDAALDGERLGRELDAKGVTKLFVTTALFHHLVREAPHCLCGRREVFFGGEAIDPAALALCLAQPAPPRRLVNLYGPTESGVVATWHEVTAVEPGSPVPIGLPIANTTVHLADRWGQPAGVGVPGELTIGGDGLATGYLGRPDLTAERFVPDPFGQQPGARLYRTGDLARRNPRGEIEFLGRIDRQVKVRGFRIELGEIESALAAQPEIAAAVVVAREDEPGDRRLVGYLVPAGGDLDVARVREALRLGLPDHMVPSAFVVLASLPLSPNGKVDRRALPAPGRGEASLAQIVAPRTPLERRVAELWAEALGAGAVGVDDSFWDLGGHSLLATKVLARVRRAFGTDLPLRTLFEHPTLGAFAAAVGAARAADRASVVPLRDRTVPAALSFAQERLWLLDRIEPGNTAYTMAFPARWSGGFDRAAFAGALAEIVRRHEALRTSFAEIDGVPVQRAAAPGPISLPWIDLGGLPDAAAQREGERLAAAWERVPFDLARGPLLRVALVELGRDEHLVLLAMHHVVSDGWSVDVFFAELTALYRAATEGRPSPLPELPVQYADFAVWQRERLTGGRLDEQLGYWRRQLAGAPPALELPTDRFRPAVPTHRGEVLWHLLPVELTASLRGLSRRHGTSLFMTLLAGFNLLLARLAGQDDVVVGSPSAGRDRVETEGLIGLFLNPLVLRTDLSGDPTFAALLARVKETALDAYRYQEIPFERLLAELQPERQLSRAPIFQVLFNMVTLELERPQLPGLAIAPVVAGEPGAKYDWTLYLREAGGRIVIQSVHDVDLFDRPRVEEMLRQLAGVLTQAVARPEAPIGSFSLVTREAAALLPDPAAPLRDDWFGAVHHGLTRSAARNPHRLALVGEEESWTYAELEARSNQLAWSLIARGVSRGDVVALWAYRCPALVWAVMGTLKAGATMMILDPAYPAARLADYLAIGRPKAWIPVPGAPEPPADVLAALPPLRVFSLLSRGALRGGSGEEGWGGEGRVEVAVGADDAACLTFTSGSTGTPKAVVGLHGSLSHFLPWMAGEFSLSPADRFGMLSALAHDPLQRDLFTPLWLGAALCVPDPERMASPGYLADWVRRTGVTVLNLTPAMMEVLILAAEEGREEMPSLTRAFVVGDALKRSDVARLRRWAPRLNCTNLYGSTETQRSLSWFDVPVAGLGREVIPLGRGMEGTQLLVLTKAGDLAGVGELGELCFRGPHLARGYLDDPALTAERFLPDFLGGRRYKTGDLGRYLPDGNAEIVGRADFQVKIRGFRIELGEVEAALLSHPGIEECVAVVREDRPGERLLVAYVVGERAPALEELRAFLAARLPDSMVPQAVVALSALPVTPAGKVDRLALPAPAAADEGYVAPRSEVEAVLAAVWAEVLRRDRVGVHDNFFALGGDSILAIKLVSRLRGRGYDLPPREVFLHQTVAAQAALFPPGSAGVPPAATAAPEPHAPLADVGVSQEELDDVLAEL